MNKRKALLDAANQLERHPESYNFQSCNIPSSTIDDQACALGWTGFFLGFTGRIHQVAKHLYNTDQHSDDWVYNAFEHYDSSGRWRSDAHACAAVLRRYADEHFPPQPNLFTRFINWFKGDNS